MNTIQDSGHISGEGYTGQSENIVDAVPGVAREVGGTAFHALSFGEKSVVPTRGYGEVTKPNIIKPMPNWKR